MSTTVICQGDFGTGPLYAFPTSGSNAGLGGPGALSDWGAPTPGYDKTFALATFDIAVRCSDVG